MDWIWNLVGPFLGFGLSLIVFWVTWRTRIAVQLALTEKRAKEAFDIVVEVRAHLQALELEIAKNYVSGNKLDREISKLESVIKDLDASVDGLREEISSLGKTLIEALAGTATKRRRAASGEGG